MVSIYVKTVFTAPASSYAPYNDLCLLLFLGHLVQSINEWEMSKYLWYLSQALMRLAVFSDCVWKSEKETMVVTLKKPPMKMMSEGLIQSQLQNFKRKLCLILSLKIKINLFIDLKIDPTFLIDDPSTWPACPTYIDAKLKIFQAQMSSMTVQNVLLKLETGFNSALSHDEVHRKGVFQIV